MDFKTKLKTRLYYAVGILAVGIVLMIMGFAMANEMLSSFGLVFTVIGLARIRQYRHITKNEETLRQREVAETDERNVMLWTMARSLTFAVYIILSAIGMVVLYIMKMPSYAAFLSYNLWAILIIYWICYFCIRRKY